jgi:hypothetical protein
MWNKNLPVKTVYVFAVLEGKFEYYNAFPLKFPHKSEPVPIGLPEVSKQGVCFSSF